MVKLVICTLVALLVFQGALAKPKAKQNEKGPLEELAANAQKAVNEVTTTLTKDLPDSKKVVEVLSTNAQTLADSVQNVVDKLKVEVKNHESDVDKVLKGVQTSLSETAENLKKFVGPENQAKAKQLREDFDKNFKSAVDQVEKLVKTIEPDVTKTRTEIEKAAKGLLDQIVDVGQNLQKQIDATVKQANKQ